MDENLTNKEFLAGILLATLLVYFLVFLYLRYLNKDTSGVKLLDKIVFKATNKDGAISLVIGKYEGWLMNFDGFHPVVRILDINGIKYDFFYYQGDDFCSLCRTNSKGIYECKRINVNFK